ncbi:MAG: response regulator, partial [Acidobacteriota bacterium]
MKTKILIVEDEGLIAHDLMMKLEKRGYSVPEIAASGEESLSAVERHRPALVLMDIHLKGSLDGIETAALIRRRFDIPVMFVTAYADRETLDRACITEPFGFIVKPFHGVDFHAQIEIALWKHGMEKRLRTSEAWLSATFRNVADALIATDAQGNIAYLNAPAEQLTGWNSAEAAGKPFLEVFHVFDAETDLPVLHPLETIYDGRELDSSPRTYRLKQRGTAGWILVEGQISENRDAAREGDPLLGVIVVFR